MASNTVPNSSPLSFAEILLGNLTRFETAFSPTPASLISSCDFVDEYCDCTARGTVHLIETEQDLCVPHFQKRLGEL